MLHTAVYGVLVVGGVCLVSLVGFELGSIPASSATSDRVHFGLYPPECVEGLFSEVQVLRRICNGGDALVPLLRYAALIASS